GRHPGSGRDAGFTALQRSQTVGEDADRRIAEAGIDRTRFLVGEARRRLGGVLELETRGEEQRLGVFVELALYRTGADRARIEIVFVRHVHSRTAAAEA